MANQFDVLAGVKPCEIHFRGRSWPDGLQVIEEPRSGQKIEKPSLGFWVFEAGTGLGRERAAAGIVPHVELIEHEACLSFRHRIRICARPARLTQHRFPPENSSARESLCLHVFTWGSGSGYF